MTNPAPDDLTTTLSGAQRITDGLQLACRIPDKTPDFTSCGGPAAAAYWAYFTPARMSTLLAALEAADAALKRHTHWFESMGERLCGGCLRPAPCPDTNVIAEALTKEAGDGS